MSKLKKAVVLLSGGMDSATLLHYVGRKLAVPEIHALTFSYGQKHSCEIKMAKWQARKARVREHKIVDLACLGAFSAGKSALTDASVDIPDMEKLSDKDRRQPPTYVPNRNMIFLSLAAAYAEARSITALFYGAQAQDRYGYWDCSVDFLKRLNRVLALNRGVPVTVYAPFIEKTKIEILEIGLELDVDYKHTWTCYRGGASPCGKCPSCVERDAAFRKLSNRMK